MNTAPARITDTSDVHTPEALSIAARFEQIALANPSKIALKDHSREVTYQELLDDSFALAEQLIRSSGYRNQPVLICLPHSVEMIVAVMAVILSNKAFIGSDPKSPLQRISTMLETSGAEQIIVDSNSKELFKETGSSIQLVNIEALNGYQRAPIYCLDPLSNIALNFTSGTTGTPKAMTRRHYEFLKRVNYETHQESLTSEDNFSQLYRIGFSAASTSVFLALLNGATLHIHDLQRHGVAELSHWLLEREITQLHIPIDVYRQWLYQLSGTEKFPLIRQIIPSGKQLIEDYSQSWKYLSEDCTFVSRYASTEVGMVTKNVIHRDNLPTVNPVPVGHPFEGTTVEILDEQLNPVKPGEVGQIQVTSRSFVGVYFDRSEPALPNSAGMRTEPDFATYLTGDYGFFNEQGMLVLQGRRDSKVKIRGYSVSTWEVDNSISSHPHVEACITTLDHDAERLLSYVVAREGSRSSGDLRAHVAQQLPHYMVPAHFIFLPELPIAQSGKIDTARLPKPGRVRPELQEQYFAPESAEEQEIAAVWRDHLELDDIGVLDNFFSLGGHSLMVTQMISELGQRSNKRLNLSDFYEQPTIRHLALLLDQAPQQELPHDAADGISTGASYQQQGIFFNQKFARSSTEYNMVKSYSIKGALNVEAIDYALNKIIHRHPALRSTIAIGREGLSVQTEEAAEFTLNILRAVPRDSYEFTQLYQSFTQAPFDLTQDLMIRAQLVVHTDNEYTLLIVTHHIATDHHSSSVLIKELAHYYNQCVNSSSDEIPPPETTYAIFASQQLADFPNYSDAADQWRSHLEYAPLVRFSPVSTDVNPSARKKLSHDLEASAYHNLKTVASWHNQSVFAAVLTIFSSLVANLSNQRDFTIGVPHSQRSSTAFSNVVGCFINMLVARCTLSGNSSCEQYAQAIANEVEWILKRSDVPFQSVVAACRNSDRDPSTPLFNVMLDYVVIGASSLSLEGVEVEREYSSEEHSKYDLTLYVYHQKDRISLSWSYNAAMFSESTAENFVKGFESLADAFVQNKTAPLESVLRINR